MTLEGMRMPETSTPSPRQRSGVESRQGREGRLGQNALSEPSDGVSKALARPAWRPANGVLLGEFLATIPALTADEKTVMVEQAILLLEGFYAHLPLKCAMHA